MSETKRSAGALMKELELLHSSPEKVFDWYKTINDSAEVLETENLDTELESKLLDRNEILINLAIAKYSQHSSSVRRVFNKARGENNEVMILACLSNTAIGRSRYSFSSIPGDLFESNQEIIEWFATLNERQIRQLFENPTIYDGFIEAFLSGKEYWNLIDEKMRLEAIRGLGNKI